MTFTGSQTGMLHPASHTVKKSADIHSSSPKGQDLEAVNTAKYLGVDLSNNRDNMSAVV